MGETIRSGRTGGLRPGRAPYYLAYAFELMAYAVWETFLYPEGTVLGLPAKMVIYVGHMAGSLAVMLLWSERFRPLIYVSAAVMAGGFVPFLLLPGSPLRLVFGFAAMAGLGGCVTCARCGYAFAANNAERLAGMVLMTVAVAGVYLMDALAVPAGAAVPVMLALLTALAVCLFLFREEDLEAKRESTPDDARGLYWALAFMMGYFAVDGYVYRLLDTADRSAYVLFIAGMALAALLFAAALAWLRLRVMHLWTIFFVFALGMGMLAVLQPVTGTALPHHLFGGLTILGWPLSLYMLACAQRRFASYKLLKRCTVIFILLSPVTTISDDLAEAFAPRWLPVIALVYVALLLVLFLLTLPYSYRHLFATPWISDLQRGDMTPAGEEKQADPFEPYGLTPREREIARLLLEARTRRQIAGELGLTESTVKTHTANLYKKLGLNSRAELFRRFGAFGGGDEA